MFVPFQPKLSGSEISISKESFCKEFFLFQVPHKKLQSKLVIILQRSSSKSKSIYGFQPEKERTKVTSNKGDYY